VTLGDPRGIGPEVTSRALELWGDEEPNVPVILVGPEELRPSKGHFQNVGRWNGTDEGAGRVSADALVQAVDLALSGDVGAIVTAPVHKPSLRAAGWNVPGQTEMLQRLTKSMHVGMLMAAERTALGAPLRVLLATTHLPLRDVASRITVDLLVTQTTLLAEALERDWRIEEPRLALCALNPHASDRGLFGDEEARIYGPAMERLRAGGIRVEGALPADTVFQRALSGAFDAVVAPYHDVGMAAFKTVSFGSGVNVTLGLPFVRTSPDHGTAFDLAGRGKADPSSMLEALRLAHRLAHSRFDTTLARG
jgi:4-hydroxythreonine-4-phosphate dehydrogenase